MKRILLSALVLALALVAAPVTSLAHPGHDHKVMGTVMTIDGMKVVVKTTEGKEMPVEMLTTTVFKRDKAKGKQADLKVGQRVVVNVGDGKEPLKAKEVQYSVAVTTAKK